MFIVVCEVINKVYYALHSLKLKCAFRNWSVVLVVVCYIWIELLLSLVAKFSLLSTILIDSVDVGSLVFVFQGLLLCSIKYVFPLKYEKWKEMRDRRGRGGEVKSSSFLFSSKGNKGKNRENVSLKGWKRGRFRHGGGEWFWKLWRCRRQLNGVLLSCLRRDIFAIWFVREESLTKLSNSSLIK